MVLFFIIWYKKYVPSISSGTNAVRAQRVLRACGTRLAPTEPEARPQVQILSHRLIKKRIVRKNGSLFYIWYKKYVPSISSGTRLAPPEPDTIYEDLIKNGLAFF